MSAFELLNNKLHGGLVSPAGGFESLKLTAKSSQSEHHLHFTSIRLCLALLYIISIQNIFKQNSTESIYERYKQTKHYRVSIMGSAIVKFFKRFAPFGTALVANSSKSDFGLSTDPPSIPPL